MSAKEHPPLDDYVGAEVPEDLKRRIRMAAAMENTSMAAWIRDVLEDATEETLE